MLSPRSPAPDTASRGSGRAGKPVRPPAAREDAFRPIGYGS
ncbi:hypothetical protein [Streptomyces sp. NPDC127114]